MDETALAVAWVAKQGLEAEMFGDYAEPGEARSSPAWKIRAWKSERGGI
jgi:hypothetical protein